ncbi:MAG: peptidase E [Candidatus Saccharimonadales bacterium]
MIIIAIGGDEVGPLVNGLLKPVKAEAIHKEIIARSGKEHPKVLFIPTAKNDAEDYIAGFQHYYLGLGAKKVDVLRLVNDAPSIEEIEVKIYSTDIIYVGGGNTFKMMSVWKRTGAAEVLKQAYERGTVMAGHSAGAICWFTDGDSDSFEKGKPFKVTGLGIIDGVLCPHYDTEPVRQEALKKIMKRTPRLVALALDECAAIEMVDDSYRILSTNLGKARRAYWKQGEYIIEELTPTQGLLSLGELLKKPV